MILCFRDSISDSAAVVTTVEEGKIMVKR